MLDEAYLKWYYNLGWNRTGNEAIWKARHGTILTTLGFSSLRRISGVNKVEFHPAMGSFQFAEETEAALSKVAEEMMGPKKET